MHTLKHTHAAVLAVVSSRLFIGIQTHTTVLGLIKDAQNQHGLRHSDYQRYRQYCSRKIRRLRKAIDYVNARGKKFQLRPVTAETAKKPEHLQILLFEAERAWSYAMQLKREAANTPRRKHHLIRRLHKAMTHAKTLENICNDSTICTPRAALDAQAYCSYLQGLVNFENQKWQAAFDALVRSRTIYTKLAGAGTAQQEALCNARIEEIDPSIRYCAYNLGQLRGGEGERELAELIAVHGSASGMEMLSDKLSALLIDSRSTDSERLSDVDWMDKKLPLRNTKLRDALMATQKMGTEITTQPAVGNRSDEAQLALYDKLLQLFTDAIDLAKQDVRLDEEATAKAKSQKSVENSTILRQTLAYVQALRLLQTISRNLVLVQGVLRRLPDEADQLQLKTGEKAAKFEDLVHLYDVIMQNWTEMRSLEGVLADSPFYKLCDSEIALYRSLKCFYAGRVLEGVGRWADALGLHQRAEDLGRTAQASLSLISNTPLYPSSELTADGERANDLIKRARARESFVKASAALVSPPQAGDATEAKAPWSARLDDLLHPEMIDVQRLHLVDFPPRFEPVPAKPVFFDLAENFLETPSLSARKESRPSMTAAAVQGLTGLLSSFWGGSGGDGRK